MISSTSELNYMSANDALYKFKNGELSPVDLLEAVITKAEGIAGTINPLADQYFEDARRRAKESEQRYRKGNHRKLEGVPLVVKDASAIKGTRRTIGSLMFANKIDNHTDPAVERLIDAGANFFARSTCPEFCWLFTCHSRMWGVTRNPWRLDITPGGSSGGSAAALAAGAATIATGSDSTGSIRQPASQCGVVGFQPPYGRNPLDDSHSFDPYANVGPMARTIKDTILMQNVMSGYHPLDHNSLIDHLTIPSKLENIRGLKIAYSIDLGHYLVADDVERETKLTMNALCEAGADVTQIDIDWANEAIRLAHLNQEFIFAGLLGDAIKQHGDKLSEYVHQLYETAASASAEDYRRSLTVAGEVWKNHLGPLFKKYDAIVTPTVSYPEIPAENWQHDLLLVNGKEVTDTDTSMTALFNMFSNCPVLNTPAGMTDTGLPVGVQIIGRPYDDITTFRIGSAIEGFRPWCHRRPPQNISSTTNI